MNKFARLVFNIPFYVVATLFAFLSIKDIWDGYRENNLPVARIIVSLVVFLVAAWIFYGLAYMYKLIVIKGVSMEKNKQIIDELMREQFTDMKFVFIGDELRGVKPFVPWKSDKEITVIFKDSGIGINIMTKVGPGRVIDSPFHVLVNRADAREIKAKFLSRSSNL